MVLENEAGRTHPEQKAPPIERRQSDQEISLNIGFRHHPGLDRASQVPDPSESGGMRETNAHVVSAAIAGQLGLTAMGAGLVSQYLRSEPAPKSNAFSKTEISNLLQHCAEILEDPQFVSSVMRESSVSFEYVESARATLAEKAANLEGAARSEALTALRASLESHKIFDAASAGRIVEAIDRDMRYGTCRSAMCFQPDDAVLLCDLLDNHAGIETKRVHEIVATALREGVGKAEQGETQALIRDTLERSKDADAATVKSIVRIWLSKSEQLDRYDVATMLHLVEERGNELTAGGERSVPSLYSGQKALRMGPLLDVGSMAGLDPAAEKIAKELVGTAALVERRDRALSTHLLTNLGIDEWNRAIEEFRRNGAGPTKPGGSTIESLDLKKALEVGLTLLGASDVRVTPRKQPNGLASKWRIQYSEV